MEPCTAATVLAGMSGGRLNRAKIKEILEHVLAPSAASPKRTAFYTAIGGADATCRKALPADTTVFIPTASQDPIWVFELRTPPRDSHCLTISHWSFLNEHSPSDADIEKCKKELLGEAPLRKTYAHTCTYTCVRSPLVGMLG